jgi:antitoxin component of MazEF toxin-antitoxin module
VSPTDGVQWMGRIHATGGSKAVVVPKELCDRLGMARGDYMAILVFGSSLVMRRVMKSEVLDRDPIPVNALMEVQKPGGRNA